MAGDTYGGVLGAFPSAFRATDSRLCRAYVLVGGLLAVGVTAVFALGIVSLIGQTAASRGGFLTSSRAFYVVVGLFFVGPLIAPPLLVARRHRQGQGSVRYDRAIAASGFLFAFSLYLGLVGSMPATFQLNGQTVTRPPPAGLFAPAIEVLYAVPEPASPAIPAAMAAFIAVIHRRYR